MFRSLPRSGTYRSKTYCMEKAFEFLKANKAVAFKNLHSIIRMLLDERTEYADWQIPDSLPKQQMMMRSLLNVRPPHPVDDDFLKAQICTYRKSGIARKTTVAYPEFRLLGLTRDFHPLDNAHAEHTKEISRKVLKLFDLSLDEQSYIETNFT